MAQKKKQVTKRKAVTKAKKNSGTKSKSRNENRKKSQPKIEYNLDEDDRDDWIDLDGPYPALSGRNTVPNKIQEGHPMIIMGYMAVGFGWLLLLYFFITGKVLFVEEVWRPIWEHRLLVFSHHTFFERLLSLGLGILKFLLLFVVANIYLFSGGIALISIVVFPFQLLKKMFRGSNH